MKTDYIIIGQGLAGSAVAMQLIERGKSVVVFDEPRSNTSSRIAAGLFNPITGKKMGKTWLANELFPYLRNFYRKAEELTGQQFFHELPIYRPFLTVEEQNEWVVRSAEPEIRDYINKVHLKSVAENLRDRLGGLELANAGFLDTGRYVDAVAEFIRKKATLIHEKFSPENVIFMGDGVLYKQYAASRIIFCAGVAATGFFDWLPIRPLKGETLSIQAALPENLIPNRGVYMVPVKRSNLWRVGSTYYFQDRSEGPTEIARQELEQKINDLISVPFLVKDHQWGFRPTTPDRRPIIGSHPEHPELVVFNGLGTKGVSLAPYFSEVLFHWLEKGGSINKEVDIERFKSVYSSSSN